MWALLVGLVLTGWASCGLGDGLFFRPNSTIYAERPANAEEVVFFAPDGPALHGWWLPSATPPRGSVVFCHGNARNLTWHVRYVAWLTERGFNVLVFDYRGYGASEGDPSRSGVVLDAVAAIDLVLARDPERTVVFGHSLGGAIALSAVARRPAVRAVVAESTFPTYRGVAAATVSWLSWLVPWLVSEGEDPVDALPKIPPRPLLVIHGTEDHIVDYELGASLFEAALEPKRFHRAKGADHFTPWVYEGEAFEGMLTEFFAEALR